MDSAELAPVAVSLQRDDIAALRCDLAFIAGLITLPLDTSYPSEVLERLHRIATNQ